MPESAGHYIVYVSGFGRGRKAVAVVASVDAGTDAVKLFDVWDSRGRDTRAEGGSDGKTLDAEIEDLVRQEERCRRDERRTGKTRRDTEL